MLTTNQLIISYFAIGGIIIPFITLNLISLFRYMSNDKRGL